MAKAWEDTPAGKAALFGWSQSVINSNAELKKIFANAAKQNWTTDHFIAMVRDTKWFKTHSDTYRQAIILQKSDPQTYKQRVTEYAYQLKSLGASLGAQMDPATLSRLAEQSLWFGWNSDQMRQHLYGYVKANKSGAYTGQAGQLSSQFSQLAAQYGVNPSAANMGVWIRNAESGALTTEGLQNYFTQLAASTYPALADRLKAGETVMQIADPYMQSYANILEVNPNQVSLKDPLIQQALASKNQEGKPDTKTIWQFENDLRNDPRYMKTQQAQDKTMAIGHQVLRDMGVIGQ